MGLMHKYLIIYLFLICPFFFSVEVQPKRHKTLDSVSDKMVSFSPSSIEIKGNLGEKMHLVIAERIKPQGRCIDNQRVGAWGG
jgi:hypothetical protein